MMVSPESQRPDDQTAPHDSAADSQDTLADTQFLGDETSSRNRASASSSHESWIGRRLGRYEIRSHLGSGGMGVVFLAFDTLIEREVAIKMLPEEVSDNSLLLERFLAEAKSAGKLNHANVVTVYEVGQEGNVYFLVMELVTGGSVADRMDRQGALSVLDATRAAADACRGLAAAEAVELVHRDIKPANLLYAADGSVKITDFGLAKNPLDQSRQMTQAGRVVGTPYFMSPEQCDSHAVDPRSDIYSLGATYYCMLTGTNPYESAGSIVQVMFAHCNGPPLDPRETNKTIPPACSQVIARATAKQPQDRYQHAGEMLADLEAIAATLTGAAITLPSQSGLHARPATTLLTAAPPAKSGRRGWLYPAIAALAIGSGVLMGLLLLIPERKSTDDPAATTAVAPAASGAAIVPPSGEPIRVGVLHSLTGTMAESESPVVEATLLAIRELNEAGGVLGRPVEGLVRDGRSDPDVFARRAETLLTEDHVTTVFGCWTSASRKTVEPIFEQHHGLLVYPVQYEGLEESPSVVYLGATPNQQIVPAVQWAFAFQNKRRFFLVGSDYIFPRAAGAIIRDTLAEMNGTVVGEEYLPLGSYDTKAVVDKIAASKADVILNTINGSTNLPFFKELRAAGITPEQIPTISFSIGEQELRMLNVGEMAGDYAAWNYFQSIDSPENKQFVERFRARYGPQRVLTDPMEAAYIGVKLWAQAARQAGSLEVAAVRGAIADQRLLAPEGEVRIDPTNYHAYKTPRIGQIDDDGQFDVVWKAVKPVAPEPFPRTRTEEQWKEFLDELYRGWGERWSAPER